MKCGLHLTRYRKADDDDLIDAPISLMESKDDKKEQKAKPCYVTHEESVEHLWIDVSLRVDAVRFYVSNRKLSFMFLKTFKDYACWLYHNFCSRSVFFTGGQAGLLFVRSCSIDKESCTKEAGGWLLAGLGLGNNETVLEEKKNKKKRTEKGRGGIIEASPRGLGISVFCLFCGCTPYSKATSNMDAIKKKMQAMKIEKDNALDRADAAEEKVRQISEKLERVEEELRDTQKKMMQTENDLDKAQHYFKHFEHHICFYFK
uniref:Endoplasmic reticulum transmembrane protein n=1 Tax=Heterorhabditis bacteriophora TaxID=37862 RepID=A0A1I7WK68_HETBA